MGDAVKVVSQAMAHALNAVTVYTNDFLGAGGIDGEFILYQY